MIYDYQRKGLFVLVQCDKVPFWEWRVDGYDEGKELN